MTGPLPDPPELDAKALAGASFGRSRRGFEPTEVRSLLGRTADALRVWAERDSKMAERIEDLSRRLDEAEEFDEDRVTELLGIETARIVAAARDAAAEIRSQAATDAADLEKRTRAEAEATAADLVSAATADREDAQRALTTATEKSERMLAEATESSDTMLSGAREEADRLLESARTEAESLRTEAQGSHDEMLAAAEAVLGERTAEAEEAATKIRDKADSVLADATSKATEDLEVARVEAQRLVAEAGSDADQLRESARDHGRAMVEEARELRRQMLHDAAEKARVGRQKVEAATAARDAVISAIRSADGHLGETLAELDESDREVRRVADSAAAAVRDDTTAETAALERQLDSASPDGGRWTDGDSPERTSRSGGGPSAADVAADADVAAEADVVALVDADAGSAAATGADPDVGTSTDAGDGERPGAGQEPGEPAIASVHDLFERIRSEDGPTARLADTQPDTVDDEANVASLADARPAEGASGDDAEDPDAAAEADPEAEGADGSGADGGGETTAEPEGDTASDTEAGSGAVADTGEDADTGEGAEVGTHLEAEQARTGVAAAADEPAVESADSEPVGVESADTAGAGSDADMLAARSELLAPAGKMTARAVKRLFGDEQNEVLDRTRRLRRGRAEVSDLLGDDDSPMVARFVEVLTEPYLLAAAAGVAHWSQMDGSGGDVQPTPSKADVTDALTAQVEGILELRRARVRDLLSAHTEAGADNTELVDRIRSVYRDYRGGEAANLAGDLAAGGFSTGSMIAARSGSVQRWRWVIDNGGRPCADAQDNALEGPVVCGEPFPTGDTVPPAHPGCRCILVPAP
ncbi:MAG: hypothetical protein ACK5O2_00080 [Microthrixaceae bacterium]